MTDPESQITTSDFSLVMSEGVFLSMAYAFLNIFAEFEIPRTANLGVARMRDPVLERFFEPISGRKPSS